MFAKHVVHTIDTKYDFFAALGYYAKPGVSKLNTH